MRGLALLSLALLLSALPAEALALRLAVDPDNVSITGPLVSVNLRLSTGGGVTTWRTVDEGRERDMTELAYPLPSLVISAFTRNVTGRYSFVLDNRAFTAALPTVTYLPWRAEVAVNSSELIVINMSPSEEAQRDISPLRLTVTVKARLWSPALEYYVTFENPSSESVTLRGPYRGPLVYLIVYTSEPAKWAGIVVDTGTDRLRAQVFNGTAGMRFTVEADAIALALFEDPKNPKSLRQVVGIEPLRPKSLFVNFSRGLRLGDATIGNAVAMLISTQEVTLAPEESFTMAFRVSYLPYNPVILSMAGLDAAAIVASRGHLTNITTLAYRDPLKSMAELRAEVEGLSREVDKLKARIGELEGLKSYLENEMKIKDKEIADLRSSLAGKNTISLGLLVLGLVLGLVGGLVAARGREAVTREVPKKKRG
ncbi:MAG: TMF family protein [Acidilobaceae archaeon]|nr:TMF family protein [Acidilobaceae archaeon]